MAKRGNEPAFRHPDSVAYLRSLSEDEGRSLTAVSADVS